MQNGYRLPPIVGSPQTVADALAGWMRETDIDGFNLTRLVAHESLRLVDLVVPELQSRGIYKEDYAPGTLREKLFGAGAAAAGSHPAASHRPGAPVEAGRAGRADADMSRKRSLIDWRPHARTRRPAGRRP